MKHDLLQDKPASLRHTLAEHFLRDAEDFAARFDVLWEHAPLMRKMGRTKSFVDLLMAVECFFKSHALLSLLSLSVEQAYCSVRRCNHDIRKLVGLVTYMTDHTIYERLADHVGELQVHLRYSFDAEEAFFPAWTGRADATKNYGATIGDNAWVLSIRTDVEALMDAIRREFTGTISNDIEQALRAEAELRQFIDEIIKTNACRQMP